MPVMSGSWPNLVRQVAFAINGYALVSSVLSLATIVSALLAPDHSITWLLLLLATVVVLFAPVTALVRSLGGGGGIRLLMGSGSMPRILLGLTALLLGIDDGHRTSVIITGGLLCLLVLAEQALQRPVKAASPVAANLPELEVPLPSTTLANWFYTVNTAAILLTGLAAVAGFSAVPAFVLAAVSVALATAIGIQAVRYLVVRSRAEARLAKVLTRYGPVFAFHWQAPAGTAYQATMWLPYLARLDRPWFVLVRTAANFEEVRKLTDAPVILRTRLEDLDSVVVPSLTSVFYANTAVRNSHMIRFPHLTHIQLNHGDSDKIASVSPTFRQYDRNFVAGQAAIDRFAIHGVETRREQFVIVGRPQLENVTVAEGHISEITSPVVLYSPTWSGFYEDSDYSSLHAGPAIVTGLVERGCTVVFRPHPYARRHPGNTAACKTIMEILAADAKASGRAHRFGPEAETEMSVVDCFNAADAMISDVSSVVSDFLISRKPFAMAAVSAHGEQFLAEFPMAKAAYVLDVDRSAGTVSGLADCLEAMLVADPQREQRLALRTYYLGEAEPADVAERFLATTRSYLDR